MGFDRSAAMRKLRQRGKDGEFPPIVSTLATDQELREALFLFARAKLDCCDASYCPFRALGGLSESTLTEVLERLSREDLLHLFELEQKIHSQQ